MIHLGGTAGGGSSATRREAGSGLCTRVSQRGSRSDAVASVRPMRTGSPRLLGALLALALGPAMAGCGKAQPPRSATAGPSEAIAPVIAPGAVSVATRNTTRLGGADPATDAAAVARTVYPALTPASRPQAAVVVDERNWGAALAASVLASAPLGAPVLYSEGDSLPAVSLQTLKALDPVGAATLGGVQMIRIGTAAAAPGGYQTSTVASAEPAVMAAGVERILVKADGGTAPRQVIVLAADAPRALAMPAAGLAAESGAPILFVTRARVPVATSGVLAGLHQPSIYVIGSSEVGARTLSELARLGRVTPITGGNAPSAPGSAAANAIAVARFTDGTFGWGVKEPGHGLVFANTARPPDAPGSALLSATGDYGPLLLLESATEIPPGLAGYLGDIQPAYTASIPAVRVAYNHGWLIGDEQAISAITQAEIDSLLEVVPRKQSAEEAAVSQAE